MHGWRGCSSPTAPPPEPLAAPAGRPPRYAGQSGHLSANTHASRPRARGSGGSRSGLPACRFAAILLRQRAGSVAPRGGSDEQIRRRGRSRCLAGRDAVVGAPPAGDALRPACPHRRGAWRAPGGVVPAAVGAEGSGRDAELGRPAGPDLPGGEPLAPAGHRRRRRGGLSAAQLHRDRHRAAGRRRRRHRQSDQPAAGSVADRRHPARDRRQGAGDAEELSENRGGAEGRLGGAERAERDHGAGSRPEPLPEPAQALDRAVPAAADPCPPCREGAGFRRRAAARAGRR